VVFDDKAFTKRVLVEGAPERLADYRQWLAERTAFDTATLERETHAYLAERGIALGDIVHAIRVAVTGSGTGPGLFECLSLVGKDLSLRRIDRALAKATTP
jgi:glutamyl-tRNA synthetase